MKNWTSVYPYQCSTLAVPLDYSNPKDDRTLNLQLLRMKALIQPAKGAILFNPGGPGAVGTRLVVSSGEEYQTILEGQYDLIGFDPRGTGNTIPYACNITSEAATKVRRQVSPETTLPEDPQDLSVDPEALSLAQTLELVQVGLDELSETYASACARDNAEYGDLVGTAFVARDMLHIVDALNQGNLLNYWGVSYGTVLGGTFAAMFPDRVGLMLLESNVNLHEYMSGVNLEARVTLDDNIYGLFADCIVAGLESCILAEADQTAASLAQNYRNLLDALDEQPVQVAGQNISGQVVRDFVLGQLYNPTDWPEIAAALDTLYQGEWEKFYNMTISPPPSQYNKGTQALSGIRCGDQYTRVNNATLIEGLVEKLDNISTWFPLQPLVESLSCLVWQQNAKERYNGNFEATTKTPILVLNNAFDNITPLISARNTSAGFSNSALLVQNSYGTQNWTEVYQDLTPSNSALASKKQYTKDEITMLSAVQSLGLKMSNLHKSLGRSW
ncbi:hypothetical protein LTR10_017078 [Elasticomyces elasticus]|nr:hypothetical protein LTR10_017078 [Elasticomyces elasticus]KAK5037197.1 hypothetical protein LTR13_005002 [Exophiala sideris]KAK5182355.1 hypothetical protein LTR44_005366 [Eurotiomycetes sp. CCFEE 6388]